MRSSKERRRRKGELSSVDMRRGDRKVVWGKERTIADVTYAIDV